MIATQTKAILLDAYRELQSKKLFWITLILSGIVVAAFACVDYNDIGVKVFWKQFDTPFLSTKVIAKIALYKNLFITLGVQIWLTYFAIILALVSTAPLFPDFLSSGAVDLYLARPLGRTRLLLTKYAVGLLFVALQVLIFCSASFLIIGVRTSFWVPDIFLAIPIVVLTYSYLWALCTAFGVITRSTIASLLMTLLVWFLTFGIHAGEVALLRQSISSQVTARFAREDVARLEGQIAIAATRPATTQPGNIEGAEQKIREKQLDEARTTAENTVDSFASWHRLIYAIYVLLPKTSETPDLLERWINDGFENTRRDARDRVRIEREEQEEQDREEDAETQRQNRRLGGLVPINFKLQAAIRQETRNVLHARSAPWLIGTSLLFEAATLALATWVFVKRDY